MLPGDCLHTVPSTAFASKPRQGWMVTVDQPELPLKDVAFDGDHFPLTHHPYTAFSMGTADGFPFSFNSLFQGPPPFKMI